jgi:transcriptional regulator with XRE-family HTH domain
MANETPQSARRAELAAFLRTQRARLRPADVGLPEDCDPGRRRTPGLRREEVAQISDVSVTWYTWLEQGRNISASEQVVEALARALLLDPDQRRHIRGLAGLSTAAGETHTDDVLPRLQRLVNAAAPNIASIYDMHFDYVVWNTPYKRLRHDPAMLPADRRNLLWMMFNDAENRARMVRWEPAARGAQPVPSRRRPETRRPAIRLNSGGADRGQPGIPRMVGGVPHPRLQTSNDKD